MRRSLVLAALLGSTALAPTLAHALTPAQRALLVMRHPRATAYAPAAVHIDYNSAYGVGSALTSTGTTVAGGDTGAVADSGDYTLSFWVQGLVGEAAVGSNTQAQLFGNQWLANDPPGSVNSAENQPGAEVNTDQASGYGTLRINNGTAAAAVGDGGVNECNTSSIAPVIGSNAPYHILVSAHTTGTGSANKLLVAYVNDVVVAQGCTYGGGTGAMLINFANARGWFLANGTGAVAQGHYGDFTVSDVYFDMSHSIVTGSNTILAADRAKFATTDGTNKPVDLGPHCVLFNSFTPQICLTGNKSDFLVNKGTVVGLTNTGAQLITDADYGPAGLPAHTVGFSGGFVEKVTVTGGVTTFAAHSDGAAIPAGALMVRALWLTDASTAPGDHAPTCPTGYSPMVGTGLTNGASYDGSATSITDLALCWKIAGVGETAADTWSWTTAATKSGNSSLLIINGANPVSPFDGVKVVKQSTLANPPAACPSVTTTNPNDRLFTAFFSYDNANAKFLTPPSGSNWTAHAPPSGTQPATGWASDQLSSAGATATKQWTAGATLRGQCLTLAIAPN